MGFDIGPGYPEWLRKAFLSVPREEFLPNGMKHLASIDEPIPIGLGQTTSQPTMIAEMLEALKPGKGMKVLEVGSGSGYVLALLEEITGRPGIGIERIPELAERANLTLERLGYGSRVVVGDGWNGLEEMAPFDRILVSASVPEFPKRLFSQLGEGGRMVYPLDEGHTDMLYLAEKRKGKAHAKPLLPCRFVKLVRDGKAERL